MSSDKKFCSNCGTPLTFGASFCINCGKKIETITSDVEEQPEAMFKAEPEQTFLPEPTYVPEKAYVPEPVYETQSAYEPNEKKEKRGVGIGIVILVAAIAALVSIAATLLLIKFGGFVKTDNTDNRQSSTGTKTEEEVIIGDHKVSTGDNVTINITGDSEDIGKAVYAKCEKSVVGIRIMYESGVLPWQRSTLQTYSEGSGVVFSENGKIITNCHVVEDALDDKGNVRSGYCIRVYLDKSLTEYYDATVLGVDKSTDLALIQIEKTGLTPIEFADGDSISVAQKVFTLGSPGGLEFMNSICEGIVSGLDRNLTTESGYVYDLIQTTAAINPGNSGGALLNTEGKLVGICSMKIASSAYDDMCFAISVKTVESIITNIEKNGKVLRPMLGISVYQGYTEAEAAENNLPVGVWIYSVEKDGAAYAAGLRTNMIITEIAGETVTSYSSLKNVLAKHEIGEVVKVKAYDTNNNAYGEYNVKLQSSN